MIFVPLPKRIVRADLRKVLPQGMPKSQKLELLKKRTALARTLKPKKAGKPRQVGAIGAGPFYLEKVRILYNIKPGTVNYDVVQKVVNIFHAAQRGQIEPVAGEQQALVNLVNNLLKAEKQKQRVKFFGAQEKVLEKYSGLL